jgi:DNA (cytosine-5)-methyltransferase 1
VVKFALEDILRRAESAFLLPSNKGFSPTNTNVRGLDQAIGTLTSKSRAEGLAQPSIVQLKGCSTAQSMDTPLTSLTTQQAHYLSVPMIDVLRGTAIPHSVDEPVKGMTTARHEALVDAFMFSIDQTSNTGPYSIDEPTRTLPTKNNQTCVSFEIARLEKNYLKVCEDRGLDTERCQVFLRFLVEELRSRGHEAKPWIYVYYSSGAVGASVDSPLPTIRTKAATAICYPAIEINGSLLVMDLFYRMLTPLELQRAMGFPETMRWDGAKQEDQIKGIGNAVSHGLARAMGLAWYTQDPDVWDRVKHLYETDERNAN